MSTEVKVSHIPLCDICKLQRAISKDAVYDARLNNGQWANVCQWHFDLYDCKLGTGFGQKLVLG